MNFWGRKISKNFVNNETFFLTRQTNTSSPTFPTPPRKPNKHGSTTARPFVTSPPIPRTPKILFGPWHPNNSFSQLLFPPPILENANRTNLRVLGFHQRDPQG